MLNKPHQIRDFRVLTLRAGLRLETKGLKVSRGVSYYAIIKREFGYKGNKLRVLEQINNFIDTSILPEGV